MAKSQIGPHVLRIAVTGVLGIPSPGGVLEKAALNPTPNRPQVLRIAVKSLIQGVPGYPKSAPSAAYSGQNR